MGCSACGGSGYRPPVRYGVGTGTGGDAIIWADHAFMEPCACIRWRWSYTAPHWPEPILVPLERILRP